MWYMVIFSIMVSVGTYFSLNAQKSAVRDTRSESASLAADMATYRNAVASYYSSSKGPVTSMAITIGDLRSAHALPSWSRMNSASSSSIWTNFRLGNNSVFIYAASPLPVNIVPDVLELSQNSMLVGMYRTGDKTLYSPVYGDTGILLPTPPKQMAIPNGSPVWVVALN